MKSWKWSNKNKEDPRLIFKYSNNKYWFECNLCYNEFERSPNIKCVNLDGYLFGFISKG